MKKFLLDTSVIIGDFRHNQEAKNLITKMEGKFCTSVICLAELYEGLARTKDQDKIQAQLQEILKTMEIYGFLLLEAEIFGKLRASLKKKGQILADMDLLIASTCLANNLTLVTLNKRHFARIKDLKILA